MKIDRISTRLVKPHTTISGSPLLVALSSSDLALPPVHVEVLYAYNAPVPPTMVLEEGLSKVLSEYREWAGRVTEDVSGRPAIELNDAGAVVFEAEGHGNLKDLWPFHPSHDLIPITRGRSELLLIQVTRFTCGGVTLGVAWHHQVADGEAVSEFLEAWASVVQGLPIGCTPLHDRSALIAKEPLQPAFDHILEYQKPPPKPEGINYPDLAVRKLHFSPHLLEKIKAEAATKDIIRGGGVVYSTFESLVAHLWKCITKARGLEDEEGETKTGMAVNVRKWLDPPLPKGYFGNVLCHPCAHAKIKDLVNKPLSFAANHIHEAIGKVNNDYARSARDFIEIQQKKPVYIPQAGEMMRTPDLSVSSWATFCLYNLDFGWGNPMFAGTSFCPVDGLVIFVPSHTKDGSIDVVVGLFAPDMENLEAICFT